MSKIQHFDPKVDYYELAGVKGKELNLTLQEITNLFDAFLNESKAMKSLLMDEKKEAELAINGCEVDSPEYIEATAQCSEIEEKINEFDSECAKKTKAFKVLISFKDEYDTARLIETFDPSQDYYQWIGLNFGEDLEENPAKLKDAYEAKVGSIKDLSDLDENTKRGLISSATYAYRLLNNEEARNEYIKARKKCLKKGKGTKIVSEDDSEKAKKASDVGKAIICGLSFTALAFIAAACIAVPAYFLKNKGNNVDKQQPGYEQIVDNNNNNNNNNNNSNNNENTNTGDSIVDNTDKDNNDDTVVEDEVIEPVIKVNFYGDATDDALVTERTTVLAERLSNNGMINLYTGVPYTVEELKPVILYMNGAYVPENEEEAYAMVDSYLNFVVALGNSTHIVYQVNYLGGENSFLPELEKMNEKYTPLCLVDNALYGNCTAYPYLKWFEENYNAMVCTTDREKCNDIFEKLTQSIVELTYGPGYELDGVVYTMNDFIGKDKVNAGNIFQLLVFNYQVFRTHLAADDYSFNNKLLGLDESSNLATYNYLDTMSFYNGVAGANALKENAIFDDSGLIVLVDPDNSGRNFSNINQMNTINNALSNYYAANQEQYKDVYQKTLNNSN